MAGTESNQDEGSDVFWPGYVDAVTNLVLNLLFVLTIMIVAVLMFAMALSRKQSDTVNEAVQNERKTIESVIQEKEAALVALQQEVYRLQTKAEIKNELQSPQKTVKAQTPVPMPEKSFDKLLEQGGGVIVRFNPDAVAIHDQELPELEKLLAPMVSHGAVSLVVSTPKGFSEAKRLAFYRVMSIRSLLMNMGLPQQKIDVRIQESSPSSDNSKVMVFKGGALK